MPLKIFLTSFGLILLLSACNHNTPPITTVPEIIELKVQRQSLPKAVQARDVQFYVVTEDNLDEFITRFKAENGELAFIAVSVRGYENLSLNIADLQRFIKQQKQIVIYYEESLTR
jgi:hypothetical protein